MANKLILRILFPLGLLVAMICLLSAPASGAPAKKKCSSFASQKAAQKYFVRNGGSESNNVSGLDPDGDGLVCPDNRGPFAAYVEIAFAKGFFYGKVVCVNYPAHRSKGEVRNEEKSREKASKEMAEEPASTDCASPYIEVELKEVAPGPDPEVTTHEAEAAEEPTTLPPGAPEKKVMGQVRSFEWKLVPPKKSGTFYALSKECYGTASRKLAAKE